MYSRKGVIDEGKDEIRLAKEAPPNDLEMEPLLKPMIIGGKIVEDFSFSLEEARRRAASTTAARMVRKALIEMGE